MEPVRAAIIALWALWAIYWLGSAVAAKSSVRGSGRRDLVLRAAAAVSILLLIEVLNAAGLSVDSLNVTGPALEVPGVALLVAGLAFAVWARVHLAANWGMPMTQRAEPELITSGPYTYVRHPIYSGLLLAGLGTAIAVNLIGLPLLAVLLGYFLVAVRIEERQLTAAFPQAYPAYRARSKALIPFVV